MNKVLMNALNLLPKIAHPQTNNTNADAELTALCEQAYEHLSDDFNTAMLLADLFEMASKINIYYNKQAPIEQVSADLRGRGP